MENKLPKGISQEVSDKFNKPGLYRHPETGAEISTYPGKRAVAQADAYVRLGFKRVGDGYTLAEIKERADAQLAKQKAEDAPALTATEAKQQVSESEVVAELKRQLKLERTARTRAENKNAKGAEPDEAKPTEEENNKEGEAPAEPVNEKEDK